MRVIRSAREMQALALRLHQQGKRLGLVPTMGALHEGHLSLIRAAASANDVVIVSIFVNPLQFGPQEDFRCYPRRLARDVRLAARAGADLVFAPSVRDMYPDDMQIVVEPGPLAVRWEGKARPGHFRGVATVVTILFELTRPTHTYFGQKDYQQALIIERLISAWHLPIRFHLMPTVREPDGLAMSSRNAYLSPAQRRQAPALYRALCAARQSILEGERRVPRLLATMRRLLRKAAPMRIEYVAVVDAKTLEPVTRARDPLALLGTVHLNRTRLIDNLLVEVS